jgi:hypothetical protein
MLKVAVFLALYFITTFLIVPVVATSFNRRPLPVLQQGSLQPLTFITCLLNRHYVRPELKQAAVNVSKQMNDKFPGTVVNYLDASFPFGNHFPLFPHLSHNDGKKLDIAFCYVDSRTGERTNGAPSIVGYGVSEEPRPDEVNTAALCEQKGFWQYSVLMKIVPQGDKEDFLFDVVRTQAMINGFTAQPVIGKIFIEPHLKERLHLSAPKIRFHGCQAVRHDDHIHVQIK